LLPAQNFYDDPFWTLQRIAIVSCFLFCVGISQAVATARNGAGRQFWRRWLQIAGCAALVSAASAWMFPSSWIRFGVLHSIAVMLLLLQLLTRLRSWQILLLALVALALPAFVQHPIFDSNWLNWFGLVTHKPITEDYAPLLPWLGVTLLGLCAGRWLLRQQPLLNGAIPALLRPVAALGRWPLLFYMLHQPFLLGGLALLRHLRYI
jgi:uncharacterized membrane protein